MKMRPEEYPSAMDHLNLRDSEINNAELGFLAKRLSRVGQLDLDYCPIDDEGIAYLSSISSIRELRLKGLNITDKSVPVILQFQDLELLHLGSTLVSDKAILELTGLEKLKTLLVSSETIYEKIFNEFLEVRPDCELIVNHKIWRKTDL